MSTNNTSTEDASTGPRGEHGPDPLAAALAEIEHLRTRAETAEMLNQMRAVAMRELATMAEAVRCQAADLCDTSHGSNPFSPKDLQYVTERLGTIAQQFAATAHGHLDPAVEDWDVPDVLADLERHGWTELDWPPTTETPPSGHRRDRIMGHRRHFTRGVQELILWFTGPTRISCGLICSRTLDGPDDLHAVIASPAITAEATAAEIARLSKVEPFDGDHDQVVELLGELGWSATTTTWCTVNGIANDNGPGFKCSWNHLPAVDVRLYSHGAPGEPATVRNWMGTIKSMADLRRIATVEHPKRRR